MVFTSDSSFSLKDAGTTMGWAFQEQLNVGDRLQDSDPFHRRRPFKRYMSRRAATCEAFPIHDNAEEILLAINKHPVTIVIAPPATGKTTQIPQMILDDALSKNEATRIVVTNPRCLGVTSTSTFVAKERGETEATALGSVGFKTRRHCKLPTSLDSILYVTEGTLIRVLEHAPFNHLLIDEFQVHSLDVDVLVMKFRQSLRIATCDNEEEKITGYHIDVNLISLGGKDSCTGSLVAWSTVDIVELVQSLSNNERPRRFRCTCHCGCDQRPSRLITCDWCGQRIGPGCCLLHEDPVRAFCHWCKPGSPRGSNTLNGTEGML